MLALTKRTEYALMALCHMARRPEALTSAREIAARHNVPLPLLMNVLKQLQQNELLESVRGARGGYRLARSPADINLAEVVAATERPVRLVACVGDEDRADGDSDAAPEQVRCELECSCPIREPLRVVHRLFEQFVRRITLADLASGSDGGLERNVESALRVLG
jgi:Rrf2 family protein